MNRIVIANPSSPATLLVLQRHRIKCSSRLEHRSELNEATFLDTRRPSTDQILNEFVVCKRTQGFPADQVPAPLPVERALGRVLFSEN